MENFKAKSDEGALRFSGQNDSRCASFIQFMFSSIFMAIIPNDLYMLQRPIYFFIYILCVQWRHLSHQIEKLTINTRDTFLSYLQYVHIWLFSMKFSGIRGSTYIVTMDAIQGSNKEFTLGRQHPDICRLVERS